MKKLTVLFLTMTLLIFFPVIAFTYPASPVIDGVFTGFNPSDPVPFNEYGAAAEETAKAGLYGYLYLLNNQDTLYILNDFYCDTTNNTGGNSLLDYNKFEFDLDNNGSFETVILVYADGDLRLKINGIQINQAQFPNYGVEGAVGWGVSPRQPVEEHRIYEISIHHVGIGNGVGIGPFDPKGSGSIPLDRNNPSTDGFDQVWGGIVTPTDTGTPTTDVPPSLIELDQFSAVPQSNQVIILWSTGSEFNNAGFNLWRSESENGEYFQINPAIIEAKGGAVSREYSYTDCMVIPGVTYYYNLEDIDTSNVSTMHGPVSTVIPVLQSIYSLNWYQRHSTVPAWWWMYML